MYVRNQNLPLDASLTMCFAHCHCRISSIFESAVSIVFFKEAIWFIMALKVQLNNYIACYHYTLIYNTGEEIHFFSLLIIIAYYDNFVYMADHRQTRRLDIISLNRSINKVVDNYDKLVQ